MSAADEKHWTTRDDDDDQIMEVCNDEGHVIGSIQIISGLAEVHFDEFDVDEDPKKGRAEAIQGTRELLLAFLKELDRLEREP